MASKALLVCLLFASACAASPNPDDERRATWTRTAQAIRPGWSREELEQFLAAAVQPVLHRPTLHGAGDYRPDATPLPRSEFYALDEDYALHLVWEDRASGPATVRSAEVVGFPDLRPLLDPTLFDVLTAIHRSPGAGSGLGFDPLLLMRAVNALQPLGKERALQALEAYVALARKLSYADARKYSVDEYRVLPIVQVLFDPPPGGMPGFVLGAPDVEPADARHWPRFPLALVRDVPFMAVGGYLLAGKPQKAEDHLRTALGPIRSAPLAPSVTPLEAAEELTRSDAWAALRLQAGEAGRKKWQIRRQALGALASAFSLRPEEITNDCCVDPTESQWRAAVDRARSSGLVWSPEIQDFILGR